MVYFIQDMGNSNENQVLLLKLDAMYVNETRVPIFLLVQSTLQLFHLYERSPNIRTCYETTIS